MVIAIIALLISILLPALRQATMEAFTLIELLVAIQNRNVVSRYLYFT